MFELDLTKINKGEVIAVALSGGKDSVALLHALYEVKDKKGFSLAAINVEHGIRGDTSKQDTEFCRALAASYGLPFKTYSVDSPVYAAANNMSIEEAARALRYQCFSKALEDGFCDKIAVAHHLSDSVETLLFNLFRGSSLSGAKGISSTREDGRIIRPLIGVSGEEIRLYVDYHALSFVQDETNADCDYTRNALRHNVIPKIKELFPKAENALARFAELAESDDEYLYSLARETLKEEGGVFYLPVGTPYPVAARAIVTALKSLGIEKDYEKVHVDDIMSLYNAISGKKITLPKGVVAVREHDLIAIKKASDDNLSEIPFKLGVTFFGDYVITCEKLTSPPEKFGGALYFDGDKLPIGALFRTRREGDEFKKFGGGTVSVKKYLTDNKFPESKKAVTPLIAYGQNVYCVCEKDISLLVAIDKNTENIIKLTCYKRKR